jgi:hypothetical protein
MTDNIVIGHAKTGLVHYTSQSVVLDLNSIHFTF